MRKHTTTRGAATPMQGPRKAVIAAILAGLGAAFAGCSSVPSRHWPQHHECTVIADYQVVDSQPVEVPASHPGLTVRVRLRPAVPGETSWAAGAGCSRRPTARA
jgi:hypothetical protein